MKKRGERNSLRAPHAVYEVHLGSWMRVPEEHNRPLTYRETAPRLAQYVGQLRLYTRRISASDGTSVLRLLGISDYRIFRADVSIRDATRFHVSGRLPAPAWDRRDTGLGAIALPFRQSWPGLFRWHTSVRTRGFTARISSRLEDSHLQLRPRRSAQLSDVERDVLVGQIPHRRTAGGRRRLHALPGLFA